MNIELIAHNSIILLGAAINIGLIFFVLYMSRKHITTPVITFMGMTFFVVIYQLSHVFGIIAPNADVSRVFFMFNLVVIPITILITHWFLSITEVDQTRRGKVALVLTYLSGFIFLALFTIYPETYLLDSVPKLYFPFYYVPGDLQIYMRIWQVIGVTYAFIELINKYRVAVDPIERNRFKFVGISVFFGFTLGFTAAFLVYDINFNPFWSSFFGLYTIPLAYAMVRYELFDIKVLAKKAVLYASAIIVSGIVITAINFGNEYIISIHPAFPKVIGQVIVSIVVGLGGIFIWRKAQEADVLKYEFLTIVTHKFRTPLTRIKWSLDEAVDSSSGETLTPRMSSILKTIRRADSELVELTNVLTTLSDSDAASHLYQFKQTSLVDVVKSSAESYMSVFTANKINFTLNVTSEDTTVYIDPEKIAFVIQILLDNALIYTPEGGAVNMAVVRNDDRVSFTVQDSGIGIPKSVRNFLFTKFYRAPNARIESTEGTGIGLFMAKLIIERSGGTISADSEGEGKGTKFKVDFSIKKR